MAKKGNPALIGAFVIGALFLVVAAVLVAAGGGFFSDHPRYVLFFEGSVKGLRVGAPVTFRGVNIGRVTNVEMLYDIGDQSIDIAVFIEFYPELLTVVGEREGVGEDSEMPHMVERGLKGQLQLQSLVTSQLFVNFDFFPGEPVELTGVDMGVPELPTIPSGFQKIARTVESLPVEEIAAKLINTLDAVENLVNAPELMDSVVQLNGGLREFRELMDSPGVGDAVAGINGALGELRTLLRNADARLAVLADSAGRTMESTDTLIADTSGLVRSIDSGIGPLTGETAAAARSVTALSKDISARLADLTGDLHTISATAGTALEEVAGTLSEMRDIIDEDSRERGELLRVLEELRGAARSLRVLAELLEQRPDALIRGKGSPGGNQ